jgi:hypothetical protein
MRIPTRIAALTIAASLTAFLVGTGAASASATTPEHLALSWSAPMGSVFTLPTTDSFDDGISANVTSNKAGTVDVSYKRLSGHGGAPFDGVTSFALGTTASGFGAQAGFSDNGLTAGSWQLTFKLNGVEKKETVKIGSGVATTVKVTTPSTKVFENSTVADYHFEPHIVAKDELGTSLPILGGGLAYRDHKVHGQQHGETIALPTSSTGAGVTPSISVANDNPGTASITAENVQGPVNSTHPPSGSSHPTVSVAKLTSVSLGASFTTLYPDSENPEATDNITTNVDVNAPVSLPLENSTVSILKGTTVVKSWPVSSSGQTHGSWNGHDGSSVVPGSYTAKVSATLEDGNTLTKTIHLTVSSVVPVEKFVTVNYPGSDVDKHLAGAGKCKVKGSALDCVSTVGKGDGAALTKSVPSAVLGLAPALGYNVVMQLQDNNYTSSGGTASYLWGSPSPAENYGSDIDITATGTFSNGPVAANNSAKHIELLLAVNGALSLDVTKVSITYYYWKLP